MTDALPTLDRIVSGLATPPHRACGCRACRHAHAVEAAARSGHIEARVGRPAGPITLREWGGWTYGVRLYDLLRLANRLDLILATARHGRHVPGTAQLDLAWRQATGGTTAPSAFRAYFRLAPALYRISRIGKPAALDIGMTQSGAPGFRVMAHFLPGLRRSSLANWSGGGRGLGARIGLAAAAAADINGVIRVPAALREIQVHLGRFTGSMRRNGHPDIRYVHVFESLLQREELPAATYARIQRRREADE